MRALAYIATYAHHYLRVSPAKTSTLACTISRGNKTYAITATAVIRLQGPQIVTHQGSEWRGPVWLRRHLGFTPSWIYHQPRYRTMRKSIKRRGCPPPPLSIKTPVHPLAIKSTFRLKHLSSKPSPRENIVEWSVEDVECPLLPFVSRSSPSPFMYIISLSVAYIRR